MKKRLAKILSIVLSILTLFSVTACAGSGGISKDKKTLNVKIHSAGYGVTYIEELKKGFEEAYSAEGYKVNVVTPDAALANQLVFKEIYADSGIDVYIATADARESTEYLGQQMFADITETVINQKTVGANKAEGDTVLSYIEDRVSTESYYYDGKYYGIPVATSIGGLAVNKKVLSDEFGITQMPRTTKEFQTIVQTIMVDNANDISNGASYAQLTHPFAYALSGNSYWMSILNSWFYQYSGKEAFESFWSFENSDGTAMTQDAYKVFNDDGLKLGLSYLYQFYDCNSAITNVAQTTYLKAQHDLMQGYAVFCPTGDWMFNEEKTVYSKYLNDVTFIKPPVVSELAINTFGAGTTYNFTDNECEELLIKIIDGADANKTVEEIKNSLAGTKYENISNDDILLISQRRGAVKNSSDTSCYISNKSNKKDIAALFLRYVASADGAKIWSKETNTTSPYAVGQLEENYEWHKSVNAICLNRYCAYFESESFGYREQLGVNIMIPEHEYLARDIFNQGNSLYNENNLMIKSGFTTANYKTWADSLATAIYNKAKYNVENKVWKIPS